MTSIISKIQSNGLLVLIFAILAAVVLVSCENAPQPAPKTRTVTTSPAETQATPKPSSPPVEQKEEAKPAPFYGSTFWDETLTSVYYYPKSAGNDVAKTHLKFNHREDDIWLCGDQRRSFEVGSRVRMTVTFELDQDCATNWKVK